MTKANFAKDTDGKWIIGLTVAAVVLATGYLLNVSAAQKSNETHVTHQESKQ